MFHDTNESENCLVKAPAKHASESVLIGELLCTSVQANTERHTKKETREMCSCWGYKQHLQLMEQLGEAQPCRGVLVVIKDLFLFSTKRRAGKATLGIRKYEQEAAGGQGTTAADSSIREPHERTHD